MSPSSNDHLIVPSPPETIPFPQQVPVLLSNDPVVFPHMIAPVVLRDDQMKNLVDEAIRKDRLVALFPTVPVPTEELPVSEDEKEQGEARRIFHVGVLCTILRMLKIPDGTLRLLVHGISRVHIKSLVQETPHIVATIDRVEEELVEDVEVEALKKQTLDSLQKAIQLTNMPEDLAVAALNVEDGGKLADLVASNLSLKEEDLLAVLEETNTKNRLSLVFNLLGREVHVLEIGSRISEKVRQSVDKNQREYYLREQIKALQGELGEADPHEQELNELRQRLEEKKLPDYALKVAERELSRLAMLQPAAAEYSVVRTYLDWILDIPWNEATDDHIDIARAARILDEDHYGLEKVKQRILEFLAVIRLKEGNLKGPILCLVGPPGVGKTSLGRSVARATGRKFTRFSLGGMRDEAEIRGHRRTYIGAMPGRIIKALKDCGTINPLIMLDEVDKLGTDFRGDPASALLEVLDPEQNDTFSDHYMDMPVNLSRVMFITTANSLDTIPEPMRDRMEIIRIAGYTATEKLEIAKRYLVPREIENNGLKKSQVTFQVSALRKIIDEYTLEAGVRGLQRQIASVARKLARQVAEKDSLEEAKKQAPKSARKPAQKPKGKKKTAPAQKFKVTPQLVDELLGPAKNYSEVAERMGRPGVAIGLAWTPFGGDILFLEASRYPGKGSLALTGQLGEVMKESGTASLTFLRANRDLLGVEDKEFSAYDYHVHVPAGATPKDGPSAGVAMTMALASLITGRPSRDYVAMTGEITLRGNVLPVGGIKEKCLAAHRAGIREVYLPERNEPDVTEIPEQVRKNIKITYIDRIEDLFPGVLKKTPKRPARKPARSA